MKYTVVELGADADYQCSIESEPAIVAETGPRLVAEPSPILLPSLAAALGGGRSGMIAALLLQQLHFKLRVLSQQKLADIEVHGFEKRFVALSATEWQREFPILSEKTIRRGFAVLAKKGWVLYNGGTATYQANKKHGITKRTTFWMIDDPHYDINAVKPLPKLVSPSKLSVPVSMRLAQSVGLTEALVLQQTHYHARKGTPIDGQQWLIKTFEQWHTDLLPCVCVRALKTAVARLEALKLLLSRNHVCSDQRVKGYRIDYGALRKTISAT